MRLFGTRLPPPVGGTAITYCSCAQSPEMFGSPVGRRLGRFDVSTACVVNWSLRLRVGSLPIVMSSM